MSRPPLTTSRVKLNPDSIPVILGYIKDRLRMIREYTPRAEAFPRTWESYAALTVIAVHSRSLVDFLGLKIKRGAPIELGNTYWVQDHVAEPGKSYEVKLQDVKGSKFSLLKEANEPAVRQTLIDGYDTVNREVMHFTYWETKAVHHGTPLPGRSYNENMYERVFLFAKQVVHFVEAELGDRVKLDP